MNRFDAGKGGGAAAVREVECCSSEQESWDSEHMACGMWGEHWSRTPDPAFEVTG